MVRVGAPRVHHHRGHQSNGRGVAGLEAVEDVLGVSARHGVEGSVMGQQPELRPM